MAETTMREATNAMQHQQRQRLPPNFSVVLKEFTRELLREQPTDILAWSAAYFKKLALEADPALAAAHHKLYNTAPGAVPPPAEAQYPNLEETPEREAAVLQLIKVFSAMDTNRDAATDPQHRTLLPYLVERALVDVLGLTPLQALYVISSEYSRIQGDESNEIDYVTLSKEGIPAIMYLQQAGPAGDEQLAAGVEPGEVEAISSNAIYDNNYVNTLDVGVYGFTREDIEQTILRAAKDADPSGLGRLPVSLYRTILETVPLQLTRRDVRLLLVKARVRRDGTIDVPSELKTAVALLRVSRGFTAFDEANQEQ